MTETSKVWGKFFKRKKDCSEWKWWEKEWTSQLDQWSHPIQALTQTKLEFHSSCQKNSPFASTSTSITWKSYSPTSSMVKSIPEPILSRKMAKSFVLICFPNSKEYLTQEIFGTTMKIKWSTVTYKLETMCSSIDSLHYIRPALWLIESKSCLKSLPWGWITLTARVTMLTSMVTRWICMLCRLTWQRQRLSSVLVIKCTKTQLMVSHFVKLCRTLLLQPFISQWRTVSSKNQITVSYFIRRLSPFSLINQRMLGYFYFIQQSWSLNNSGQGSNW